MDVLSLQVSKRQKLGKKAQQLIDDGKVLGNIYGKGIESVAIEGDYRTVNKTIQEAGRNHPIEVQVEGGDKHLVLVHELERNNVTQKLHHVSFLAIKRGQKVTAEVPIHLVGDAPATRTGMIIVTLLDSVEVETTPAKIPESFEVSIEGLVEVNDHVTIADLKVDDDVEIMREPEEVIAKVDIPRAEIEEEAEEDEGDAADVPSDHGGDEDGESDNGGNNDSEKTEEAAE